MSKVNKLKKCKVCGRKTRIRFNIDFKPIPICWFCESWIVRQSIDFKYSELKNGKE